MPKKKPAQFQPATEDPKAALYVEVARLRAMHHLRDASRIIIDVMPYVPFQVRAAYLAISGSLSTLERHLEELNPESKL
jgi:hypothetical protein